MENTNVSTKATEVSGEASGLKLGDEVMFTHYYEETNSYKELVRAGDSIDKRVLVSNGEQSGIIAGVRSIGVKRKLTMNEYERLFVESIREKVYVVAVDMRTLRYVPVDRCKQSGQRS